MWRFEEYIFRVYFGIQSTPAKYEEVNRHVMFRNVVSCISNLFKKSVGKTENFPWKTHSPHDFSLIIWMQFVGGGRIDDFEMFKKLCWFHLQHWIGKCGIVVEIPYFFTKSFQFSLKGIVIFPFEAHSRRH